MLTIGDRLPSFQLQSVVSIEVGKEFAEITDHTHQGKWKLVFAWPMDFTFVCPTEIAAFGARTEDFEERDCQVLGMSCDTQFVHLAWRKQHPDLKNLPFPMLADTKRELSVALGILHKTEGVPLRATFLVDPQNVIRWVSVNDLKVGRSVDEVLRVLHALQTDELCPCNWKAGEKTLEVLMEALRELSAFFPEAAKDLKLNLQSVLSESSLSEGQRWLVALSCALSRGDHALARALITAAGPAASEALVDDAKAVAALMAMNNVYYRFRHVVGRETYSMLPARLRMSRLGQPQTNKADFELASLAVSALNGCELCVQSHEQSVRAHGLSEAQVHDAARIAAVIAGASTALSLAHFVPTSV